MFTYLKKTITQNLSNLPGWRTNRKIIVFESDDWGSIRMPSQEIYQQFLDKGIRVDKNPYCKYDCLASKEDLEALFDVLTSVKDKNGCHAVITANTIVANPDFEKIKASDFTEYFYEPFTETLKRRPKHAGAFKLWKQGIRFGIFHPQFHGREHLNVNEWLRKLQSGDELARLSFNLGTFGLTPDVDIRFKDKFLISFNSGLDEDIQYYNILLKEGLNLFESLFGYRSKSFIATSYTWHPKIEQTLKDNDVKFLQGMILQRIPLDDGKDFKYKKNNFLGTKSESGLIYLMRNCYFEPSQYPKIDWVNDCLKRINIAFRWHKPATISVHRLNFIGSIDLGNRERNLKLFDELLTKIVAKWPDIEFMSSDQLGDLIAYNLELLT